MQSQRLRMVSDSELRLEQFQAERKDEKRRYEDALDRLKQVCASNSCWVAPKGARPVYRLGGRSDPYTTALTGATLNLTLF